jgi:hypothetical protein
LTPSSVSFSFVTYDMPLLDAIEPNSTLLLKLRASPELADRLTLHFCTCDDCRVGAPPRRLCAAAEKLVTDSVIIEVLGDGSDQN